MYNINFSTPSMSPTTDGLICVWIPTSNPRSPLTCVWLEDRHFPTNFIAYFSSIAESRNQEGRKVQPCA